MKKTTSMQRLLALVLLALLAFSLFACHTPADTELLWENALYQEDATLGEGEKTVTLTVTAAEKSVTFTISTDCEILGDALLALNLISGDESAYGLYVKYVNGIFSDYNVDQTYWALYIGENYASGGVDTTPVEDGVAYAFVRSK